MDSLPEEQFDIVYALLPATEGTWFAARQSGLFRSDDSGQTWQSTYDSLNLSAPLATASAALSPEFATDQTLVVGVQGGVIVSRDGGATWKGQMFPQPHSMTAALITSPGFTQDGIIIAGTTDDGIYRSEDGGHSWRPWNFGLLDRHVFCLAASPDFARDQTVLAGTETELYRSTNSGRAWHLLPLPADDAPVLCLTLLSAQTILAGTEASGLLRSEDGGTTWVQLMDMNQPVNAVLAALPHLVALVGGQVWVSQDSGSSWAALPGLDTVTAIAAPTGITPGSTLLVGLEDGTISTAQL